MLIWNVSIINIMIILATEEAIVVDSEVEIALDVVDVEDEVVGFLQNEIINQRDLLVDL
jgi:hypothetical protein